MYEKVSSIRVILMSNIIKAYFLFSPEFLGLSGKGVTLLLPRSIKHFSSKEKCFTPKEIFKENFE
jgi:hypothetical protein